MLTRFEIDDLCNGLLRQCPGPLDCLCKFCKTRRALDAYARVVALLEQWDNTSEIMASVESCVGEVGQLRRCADELRRALEGK